MNFMKTTNRDKVRGTFLGIAIGDALGMPVESFSRDQIGETYGRITRFHAPDKHKWFEGEPAGMITDDTQLSLAVAQAIIESGLDMDAQVEHHKLAFAFGTKGWGKSTKESVRRLVNGASWKTSGQPGGVGNGVAMKIAPVGLYLSTTKKFITLSSVNDVIDNYISFVFDLAMMTHPTRIAVTSALAQATAVSLCFLTDPELFNKHKEDIIDLILLSSRCSHSLDDETDDLVDRLTKVLRNHEDYDTNRCIEELGGGSCYCYNSIPFSLVHFFNNPNSIDCLYDVVTAGGDTDSNGSMVGALLGALNGASIFPEHLLDFPAKNRVLEVADCFFDSVLDPALQQ
jgi:ADP-ribosylglycohydrolase